MNQTKRNFYGHVIAIIGALSIAIISSIVVLFGSVKPITNDPASHSVMQFLVIALIVCPSIFAILMTLDIWHKRFNNFIFRRHLVFLAAIISFLPTLFSVIFTGVGFGIIFFPSSILTVIGLVLSFTEHLKK